jgi:hypothetical protein
MQFLCEIIHFFEGNIQNSAASVSFWLWEPRKKSELFTEKCVWETSKKKGDSFYMKSRFNAKKCNHT